MSKKQYIAGNWKMNMLSKEAIALATEIVKGSADAKCKVMIAPPFTALSDVAKVVKGTNVILGAQNMSDKESGAHTGEISIDMLKDLGVSTVILGHSERRHVYGETDQFVNNKVKLALSKKMEVILCVGETLEEREAGKVAEIVSNQILNGLKDIPEGDLDLVVIAYEPVWAIGTGKTATDKDADDVHIIIRNTLAKMYSASVAEKMVIQYGGSVKPDNAAGLLNMENIDGALVGGAALKADSFLAIVKSAK